MSGELFPIIADSLDIVLSVIGFVPGLGDIADAIAVGLNMYLQDPIAIFLSVIAITPVAGHLTGAIKIVMKLVKILEVFFAFPQLRLLAAIGGLIFVGAIYYFIYYI